MKTQNKPQKALIKCNLHQTASDCKCKQLQMENNSVYGLIHHRIQIQTFSFMSSCSRSIRGCSATMERRERGKLGTRFCRHSSDCISTGICSTACIHQNHQCILLTKPFNAMKLPFMQLTHMHVVFDHHLVDKHARGFV